MGAASLVAASLRPARANPIGGTDLTTSIPIGRRWPNQRFYVCFSGLREGGYAGGRCLIRAADWKEHIGRTPRPGKAGGMPRSMISMY